MMEGYLHPLYAESFAGFGTPLYLPNSKGWLVKRAIPGTPYFDAMGPYPLFFCEDWDALPEDLEALKDEIVSISLVIGPFSKFPTDRYQAFFDIFRAYKDHYILDLSMPLEETISKSRRKDARRALRYVDVDVRISPEIELDEWTLLYDNLVKHHQIKGIRAFSRDCFREQLKIPGMHLFRGYCHGDLIGGNLYILQDDAAYYHLSAFTDEGYQFDAAYAVKWYAIGNLAKKVRWMNLGGGTSSGGIFSGLDQFKQGWSNLTRKSYLCGKILSRKTYNEISLSKPLPESEWFPAYRIGEY